MLSPEVEKQIDELHGDVMMTNYRLGKSRPMPPGAVKSSWAAREGWVIDDPRIQMPPSKNTSSETINIKVNVDAEEAKKAITELKEQLDSLKQERDGLKVELEELKSNGSLTSDSPEPTSNTPTAPTNRRGGRPPGSTNKNNQ